MPWINDDPDCDHCVPVGRTACYYDGHVTTGGRGPFLRIPPPSVLLAMEEFVAAYRAWDVAEGKPVEERYAEERAFQRLVDRRDATWYALARAEAEAKEAR